MAKCRHQWIPYRGHTGAVQWIQSTAGGPFEPHDNWVVTAVRCAKCGKIKRFE